MLKFYALELIANDAAAEEAVCLQFDVPEELTETFAGQAGQHIVLKAQIDGTEVRRSYCLVNAPGEVPLRIGVRQHAHGQMSNYLASMCPGDRLDLMPPNGSFVSTAREVDGEIPRRYVAFAAGCGITPVIALIKSKLAAEPACEWILFYGNRHAGRAMFVEELLGLKDRFLERLSLHFVMSGDPQPAALLNGRIDGDKVQAFAGAFFVPTATDEYFLCGPDDMISAVTDALTGYGVDPQRVHMEHFTVATVAGSKRPEDAADPMEGSAEVTVIMDGRRRSFTMELGDTTLLEAALEAGIELPYSCCAGVCSTCRTKAVDGEVDMIENFALEEWELEQGYVLACQSRPLSRVLVLDYDDV